MIRRNRIAIHLTVQKSAALHLQPPYVFETAGLPEPNRMNNCYCYHSTDLTIKQGIYIYIYIYITSIHQPTNAHIISYKTFQTL